MDLVEYLKTVLTQMEAERLDKKRNRDHYLAIFFLKKFLHLWNNPIFSPSSTISGEVDAESAAKIAQVSERERGEREGGREGGRGEGGMNAQRIASPPPFFCEEIFCTSITVASDSGWTRVCCGERC